MGTFIYWLGLALVLIVVAIGVKEIAVGLKNKEHDSRRLRQITVLLVVGLIVVFVPPLQLLNRAVWRVQFGTFSATSSPPRIDLCGRRFYPSGTTESLAQAQAKQGTLQVVARTPGGNPILAHFSHPVPGGNVCAFEVYVRTGPNRYLTYGLSGGP